MDFFSDDDDEDECSMGTKEILSNAIFVELMKIKSQFKKQKFFLLVMTNDSAMSLSIVDKIRNSNIENVQFIQHATELTPVLLNGFDTVLELSYLVGATACVNPIMQYVNHGGHILIPAEIPIVDVPKCVALKNSIPVFAETKLAISVYQKELISFNPTCALRWKTKGDETALLKEQSLLDEVTVALSVGEKQSGCLTSSSQQKAVNALCGSGLCIIRGLFSNTAVREAAAAAEADMDEILDVLKREKGVDLRAPLQGQLDTEVPADQRSAASDTRTFSDMKKRKPKKIENYFELSMREAFRFDIRHGTAMKKLRGRNNSTSLTTTSQEERLRVDMLAKKYQKEYAMEVPVDGGDQQYSAYPNPWLDRLLATPTADNIRWHPAVLAVLTESMSPYGGQYAKGNWGKWNFEMGGPENGPTPVKAGELGCLMTVPGCQDQTIHTDTPHLYEGVHLPPHYVNLFVPAPSADSSDLRYASVYVCAVASCVMYVCEQVGSDCFRGWFPCVRAVLSHDDHPLHLH